MCERKKEGIRHVLNFWNSNQRALKEMWCIKPALAFRSIVNKSNVNQAKSIILHWSITTCHVTVTCSFGIKTYLKPVENYKNVNTNKEKISTVCTQRNLSLPYGQIWWHSQTDLQRTSSDCLAKMRMMEEFAKPSHQVPICWETLSVSCQGRGECLEWMSM